jgi:hypothetical protein
MLAAALAGGVSALVASNTIDITDIICGEICIDGVNECGQPFGVYEILPFLLILTLLSDLMMLYVRIGDTLT